jgi:Glycosyl hydrolases family 43
MTITTASATSTARIRPGDIWPDESGVHINAHGGGMLVHEGVYYWFGEHKIGGEAGNAAHVGVHVYSSTDLLHWTDRGIALSVVDTPGHDIERGCVLERPKVIFNARTRQFVMWFHLELKGQGYAAARAGVAISNEPTGPFRFLGSSRMNAGIWPMNAPPESRRPLDADDRARAGEIARRGSTRHLDETTHYYYRRDHDSGQMSRDMTLFVDDDGAAYQLAASEENSTLHITRLSDDYTASGGKYVRVFPNRFHEAPAVFKHRGRYYMISNDCTGWAPNAARLSVADHLFGPWVELGNPCRGTAGQNATTFHSQATYVLPVDGGFIYMGDRWRPEDAIDGRYVWLPIDFENGLPVLNWRDAWSPTEMGWRA